MRQHDRPFMLQSNRKIALRIILYGVVVMLLSQLNALVDAVLHPDIPYFDEEHLIVGGVTALVMSILFGLLMVYEARLRRALGKTLEAFLPICSNCKKIREPGLPAEQMESWQTIEFYLNKKTNARFTHGICPECVTKLYPDLHRKSP
ncbi:MAG: hypothetical protein JXO49_00285 [Deltaproteobacteria bacterium]|nr:hypothetical protein [Candidatus Anaeroferrophillus wilburensis]MBN2887761.1 hypothetical protein [Deltaproteobacteria bacterium]